METTVLSSDNSTHVKVACYILIAVGAFSMLLGFLGCLGAIYEVRCLLGLVSPALRQGGVELQQDSSDLHRSSTSFTGQEGVAGRHDTFLFTSNPSSDAETAKRLEISAKYRLSVTEFTFVCIFFTQ